MQHPGHSMGLGLTMLPSARFSSQKVPPAQTARAACALTENMTMKALVCCSSGLIGKSLVSELQHCDDFTHVVLCNSAKELTLATDTYPEAFVFTDLATLYSVRNCIVNRQDWIVVGEGNRDALEAFSTHAMSFLSAPVDRSQLNVCVARLRKLHQSRVRQHEFAALTAGLCEQYGVCEDALAAMLRRQHQAQSKPDVVSVRSSGGWCCLSAGDIQWIEAAGDYMCIHTPSEQHIVRSTLGALKRRFADVAFLQCNRSTVVNIAHVQRVVWRSPTVLVAELKDGTQLKISRRCYAAYWQQHPLAKMS